MQFIILTSNNKENPQKLILNVEHIESVADIGVSRMLVTKDWGMMQDASVAKKNPNASLIKRTERACLFVSETIEEIAIKLGAK